MYNYIHIYIYIYIHIHMHMPSEALPGRRVRAFFTRATFRLGTEDHTPEIGSSEITVDFQWYFQPSFTCPWYAQSAY